ncbi:hypothetical protein F7734_39730 [Scytonema sp. UIC 10036]|uniref:hypothetical protein n=1 Tax=Scytonema sp. UIC 10036 TaxID=2304196 RepID=UPI0012DA2A10|nr:hypothetical protein [Scytonema sp. UIC 10036]MUG98115.1 hypothetical protein [Scytonema sp. UIC 10036]
MFSSQILGLSSSLIMTALLMSTGYLQSKAHAQTVNSRAYYEYFRKQCAFPLYKMYVSDFNTASAKANSGILPGMNIALASNYQVKIGNCLTAITVISAENREICRIGDRYFEQVSGYQGSYIAYQRNCGRY